ncbi:hypothetical protein BJ912DRAFT_994816 [Pholiota molesta]|nr:hypothetical protein BJ912DRAFT_994816 [Pholiota molesta]
MPPSFETLSNELYEELGSSCRGPVYRREETGFLDYSTIFNGNVVSAAKAVVCPLDAEDVSKIVLFCTKHSLSPSVKAGGYGTAGWAIGGDIIIDLSKLVEVDIEVPKEDGSFTSLRDVAPANSKGKMTLQNSAANTSKRRREEDINLRHYDSASHAVASFLRGPIPASTHSDGPSPSVRRRVDNPEMFATSPSVSPTPSAPNDQSDTANANPFGYLDTPSNFPPAPPPAALQSTYTTAPLLTSWGPVPDSVFASAPGDFGQVAVPAQAEPIHPHAFVTFGAGMRQKEIDTFTAKEKLEARYLTGSGDGIPYHVPFRLHGLSVDNLVEVEMVLADGRIIIINENDYPDLWWGLRGAGSCFGIATRYKAKAFPVPVATAPSLIKHFRDCNSTLMFSYRGPRRQGFLVVVQMCYVGPREKGQEYLAAISSWDGERCLLNEVDEKSFLHQQDSVAQVLRGKAGRQWFIRSALISSLPDDIINETVMQFADTPVGCTWLFELAGGAISDFEDTCIPKSQREASFTIAALHQWEMVIDDDRCIDSAEEWIAGTLKPVHIGGPFPSFLGRHEPAERVKACFGDNWSRLCEIKGFYDPKNLFKNSLWPLDAAGEMVEPQTHEPPTPEFLTTSVRGQKRKLFI